MSKTLSVITIIYNEEKLLERCLSSVQVIADELIVFHDGPCSDNSLNIASKFTSNIVELEHQGYIEAHMANALSRVKSDWVLILDADEYLSEKLRLDIRALINDDNVDAYSFLEPIFIPEENSYTGDVIPRRKNALLRMKKMFYIGLMHRGCETYGNLKKTDYILEHKPLTFNFTFSSYKNKWRKMARKDVEGYFIPWSKIGLFNYSGSDPRVSRKNKFKIEHPFLAMPFVFCLNFFIFLKSVNLFSRAVYYFAFLEALYGATVCFYIKKYKNKHIAMND